MMRTFNPFFSFYSLHPKYYRIFQQNIETLYFQVYFSTKTKPFFFYVREFSRRQFKKKKKGEKGEDNITIKKGLQRKKRFRSTYTIQQGADNNTHTLYCVVRWYG